MTDEQWVDLIVYASIFACAYVLITAWYEPEYKVRYTCTRCGENVGYLGWMFTMLRIPMLKHKCKENT